MSVVSTNDLLDELADYQATLADLNAEHTALKKRLAKLEKVLEAAKRLAPLVARSTDEWIALDEAVRAAEG